MINKIKLFAAAACVLFATSAHATVMEYTYLANFGQRIIDVETNEQIGSANFRNIEFKLVVDDVLNIASLAGGGVGSFNLNGRTGTISTFILDTDFNNIVAESGSILGTHNSTGGGLLSLAASIGNTNDSVTYDVMAKHANIRSDANSHHAKIYGVNGRYNLVAGQTDATYSSNVLHAWMHSVMGESYDFFNHNVRFGGDIHGYSLVSAQEIPEPMTSALLLGGLGATGLLRKRAAA